MNKQLKLIATLLVVALCTTTVFTSCRNDDDDNGDGTLEIRATNIANLPNEIRASIETVRVEIDGYIIGEAPFGNSFTLELRSMPSRFLFPITEEFPGLTINNRSANSLDIEAVVLAFDKDGRDIGVFAYEDIRENDEIIGIWFYVDRNVTIRGTYNNWVFDLNLRRGWNVAYEHFMDDDTTVRFTSQRPTGANLRWVFRDWSSWSSHSATTKATENRNSFFRR